MIHNIWLNPLFWIGIYLVGYTIAILSLSISGMQTKVENKIPKPLVRIFTLLTFVAPPIILPFTRLDSEHLTGLTKSLKLAIPTWVALTVGILLLGTNFIVKILAQRQIGLAPALKGKAKLITTGVYGIVRHPLT